MEVRANFVGPTMTRLALFAIFKQCSLFNRFTGMCGNKNLGIVPV